MKKLFLLIIASWATSCLPVPDTQSPSAQTPTKTSDEIIQENQTLTITNKELKKKNIRNNSFNNGILFGLVGLAVPAGYAYFSGMIIMLRWPVRLAVGLTAAAACSFVQDRYRVSQDDKNNTTANERAFAYAQGIWSAIMAITLSNLARRNAIPIGEFWLIINN